jgi:anti-sigma B factor antagonist
MNKHLKEVRREGAATVAVPTGEIDLQSSPALYGALMQVCRERPRKLVIDLHEVKYMDSSGVSTLVEVFRCVNGYGGKLVLLSPTARVRGMFEIAKLDQFFTITDNEHEALTL